MAEGGGAARLAALYLGLCGRSTLDDGPDFSQSHGTVVAMSALRLFKVSNADRVHAKD